MLWGRAAECCESGTSPCCQHPDGAEALLLWAHCWAQAVLGTRLSTTGQCLESLPALTIVTVSSGHLLSKVTVPIGCMAPADRSGRGLNATWHTVPCLNLAAAPLRGNWCLVGFPCIRVQVGGPRRLQASCSHCHGPALARSHEVFVLFVVGPLCTLALSSGCRPAFLGVAGSGVWNPQRPVCVCVRMLRCVSACPGVCALCSMPQCVSVC